MSKPKKLKKKRMCIWTRNEEYDFFETECGEGFSLIAESLKKNKMKFCCFCGRLIKELK